jgi:hypothetical protein
MANKVERFSYTCWPFTFHLSRSVCSDHLPTFKTGLVVSIKFFSSLCILDMNLCQMNSWQIFLPFCKLPLHSVDYFLAVLCFLFWCNPFCLFYFCLLCFGGPIQHHCLYQSPEVFLLYFLLIVSEFPIFIRSLIHLELIFPQGERTGSSFCLLYLDKDIHFQAINKTRSWGCPLLLCHYRHLKSQLKSCLMVKPFPCLSQWWLHFFLKQDSSQGLGLIGLAV